MRRYDDPVDVRRGQVAGAGGGTTVLVEGPAQFLWRGRLWRVTAVVAHWVETGAWWQSSGVHAVLGADEQETGSQGSPGTGSPSGDTTASPTDPEDGPVPLYLAGDVTALGTVKLIMGLPLFAPMVAVTWLAVRALYPKRKA